MFIVLEMKFNQEIIVQIDLDITYNLTFSSENTSILEFSFFFGRKLNDILLQSSAVSVLQENIILKHVGK